MYPFYLHYHNQMYYQIYINIYFKYKIIILPASFDILTYKISPSTYYVQTEYNYILYDYTFIFDATYIIEV